MKLARACVSSGLIVSLAGSVASAAPSVSPTAPVVGSPTLTWRLTPANSAAPWITEYELFEAGRRMGWARIERDQPTNQNGNAPFCPSVTFSYIVNAGSQDISIGFTSAILSFPAIPNAQVRFSGNAKVTDNDFSGATFTGMGAGGAAYEAVINGPYNGGGTSVAGGLFSPIFADDGEMASDSFDTGCFGVGDLSSMQIAMKFELTAGDKAEGSARFEVCCHPVPLPTGGAMGLAGLLGLGAIRRRRA